MTTLSARSFYQKQARALRHLNVIRNLHRYYGLYRQRHAIIKRMEKSKQRGLKMKKISDKVVKTLICGTFLLVSVSAAKAAGVADLGQSFREMSQTIKAHLPSPQAAPQSTENPCSNADSDVRRRLCQEG